MKVFWRKEPLNDGELGLLTELRKAHFQAAFRENSSTRGFLLAVESTGDFAKGLTAALSTLGGSHAPIEAIYDFLATGKFSGSKIPGWGNSFVKGEEDPIFVPVRGALGKLKPEALEAIDAVTKALHDKGKDVYPNPGCWTAVTAIVLGLPKDLASYLFISPRLDAWAIMQLNPQ